MIGKVLRGINASGLLRYLYGPGQANEHTDPHLVAGFSDPAELEPDRRPGGSPDLRRLAGLLAQPLAALSGPGCDKPVWHCSVRAAPEDRTLPDGEWAQVAAGIMHRTGLAPLGDELGVQWVAVRSRSSSPACAKPGSGPAASQHDQPRSGDRVRGRPGAPHGQRRRRDLVWRRQARRRPDSAQATGALAAASRA